ncbi:hypothetical protein RHMOL_Rhmol05G0168500 [Rhododendron molle]|uniref:Uncharacterized protein n=1 Tax=Rhododendron molle TaxID=49168 RepID=A0ACC0NS41_RHOML|nr:hypothetical protein RHMOL_Rhmol05G0168500 [Rhododendron molle]
MIFCKGLLKDAIVTAIIRNNQWAFPMTQSPDLNDVRSELQAVPINNSIGDRCTWTLTASGKFTISSLWEHLRKHFPDITWYQVVWFFGHIPRCSVISWMAILNRLSIEDRLVMFGMKSTSICSLCLGVESRDHLFFECPVATQSSISNNPSYGRVGILAAVAVTSQGWLAIQLSSPGGHYSRVVSLTAIPFDPSTHNQKTWTHIINHLVTHPEITIQGVYTAITSNLADSSAAVPIGAGYCPVSDVNSELAAILTDLQHNIAIKQQRADQAEASMANLCALIEERLLARRVWLDQWGGEWNAAQANPLDGLSLSCSTTNLNWSTPMVKMKNTFGTHHPMLGSWHWVLISIWFSMTLTAT